MWLRSTPSALFPASSSLMASESPCSAGSLRTVCCPYTRLFQVGHISSTSWIQRAGTLGRSSMQYLASSVTSRHVAVPFFWKFFRSCQATPEQQVSSQTCPASAFLRAFSFAAFVFLRCSRFRSFSFPRISRGFSLACKQKCLRSCHMKETLPPRLRLEQLSTAHFASSLLPSRQHCAFCLACMHDVHTSLGSEPLLRPPRLCVPFLLQRGGVLWPPWPGPWPTCTIMRP